MGRWCEKRSGKNRAWCQMERSSGGQGKVAMFIVFRMVLRAETKEEEVVSNTFSIKK
jgi:hypothetical protein